MYLRDVLSLLCMTRGIVLVSTPFVTGIEGSVCRQNLIDLFHRNVINCRLLFGVSVGLNFYSYITSFKI